MTLPERPTMANLQWRFDHSYARLPETLYSRHSPARPASPRLLTFNRRLADDLGLVPEGVAPEEIAAQLSGERLPEGAQPIAQAYAGHQFGHFAMLGDGRALLLGEHLAPDGRRFDVQLKGSGQTSFSRRGDGRAAVGPMLREYLISEAMHALGIPSTRSLAVVATGDPVYREEVLDGAVLTRIAASHLRVGTFQYAAARRDDALLAELVRHALERHDSGLLTTDHPALALLDAVIGRQADLIVHWMRVGFVHGVMNTDNMTISGETIDYGPCAFIDAYDPRTVFSSIDHAGRYAWGNQPAIAQWNLARLAEALLPVIDPDTDRAVELAEAAISGFVDRYERGFTQMMRSKIGLTDEARDGDAPLVDALLAWMRDAKSDYTNTFVALARTLSRGPEAWEGPPASQVWLQRWRERVAVQPGGASAALAAMSAANPVYVPRNHQVEAALSAWASHGDRGPFDRLLEVLAEPYREREDGLVFTRAAPPSVLPYQTFCGT
jgi:uncharacterized protein YdiU (UPF0061 family)